MVVRLFTLMFLALALVAAGCGGGGGGSNVPDPTLRFVNAAPDSVGLDLLFDDDAKATNVPYLGSTPNFVKVGAGERDLRLKENASQFELTSEVFNFQRDRHYVTAGVGLVDFGSEPLKRLRALTFEVDRTIPNGSKSRLYVIHAYHRSLGFQTPPIDFQSPGDNPVFRLSDIGFAGQKSILVDAGTQTFEVRRSSTQNVLHSATETVGAGKIYVVVFGGIEGELGNGEPVLSFIELQPE